MNSRAFTHGSVQMLPGVVVLGICLLTQLWSEALCPTLLELFSIALLSAIFMFAWNARAFLDNDYFVMFALACMAVLAFEVIHLFSQPWFAFVSDGPEISGRALIASRGLTALVLFIAPAYLNRRVRHTRALLLFAALSAVLSVAIVLWPGRVYLNGAGQPSAVPAVAHGVFAFVLLAACTRLSARGNVLHPEVLHLVRIAIVLSIAAEIAFAIVLVGAVTHILGHLLEAASLYFMYRGLVEIGLTKPYELMFRNLQEAEAQVRDISLRDELTDLYNRRGFFSLANQQTRIANRTGRNMLLFYCDVDALKSINDTLGHGAGDMALQDCADVLRQTFRDSDIVARTGGDEFVVLAIESSNRSVETLRARLEANLLAFEKSARRPYRLELSIGIATYDPLLEESLEQTLQRADALMYRHKQARKRARKLERSEFLT